VIGRQFCSALRIQLWTLVHNLVVFPALKSVLNVLSNMGYRAQIESSQKATVVILSYKRVENIPVIVQSALLCEFVERVVVCNNNPDIDLQKHFEFDDPRYQLVQQKRRRWPSYRFDVARNNPSEHYICIDDDVFPTPRQFKVMFLALLRNPESPIGSAGAVFNTRNGQLEKFRRGWFSGNPVQKVDVIEQTYFFTRAHLERYFELLEAIAMDNESVHSSEDVILSFTGSGQPGLMGTVRVLECPSSWDPGIATHRQDGFTRFRYQLFHKLQEMS
jgi:hypothetical protein